MCRALDLAEMLRQAAPATRREVLKRAAAGGIAAPALLAVLAKEGVAPADAAPAARQDGDPVQGGTLVLMGHQEVASLSPDDSGPTVHYVVVNNIHNALVEQDENFAYVPVLAAEMPTVSEDGLTYTFTLREGVKFHDLTDFTSEDVKYTYEWYMNSENAAINANLFDGVESVEASSITITSRRG